jgi:predicted RND superfamily exporter protein
VAKGTLLVLGPLILASLLTCSVNVLLGIPFNFANIIALPLLLGMGVDSGIHIMHCLHEQLEDNQHILQSSTARGVMFSSITTMSSFISLALIPHFGIAPSCRYDHNQLSAIPEPSDCSGVFHAAQIFLGYVE